MKKVAILQSNYIPWKGYFDLIAHVDEFIIFDDAQYTTNDWRNRNKIKTPNGLLWLTVPVKSRNHLSCSISGVQCANSLWARKHWKSLAQYYCRAPYFAEIANWLQPLYLELEETGLSRINLLFIQRICQYLGIMTKITSTADYALADGKTDRLVSLCQQAGASEYVSGPAARCYIEVEKFQRQNLALSWFEYENYPEYPQLHGNFEHQVSILDLLFNCGPHSWQYMKHVRGASA